MRFALVMGLALLSGCAHERPLVAKVLSCPEEQLQEVAQVEARAFVEPRQTRASEAAMSGAAAAVGALASLVGAGAGAAAYYLPAGSVQLEAPGWRHYEGCQKAALCFDGGFCLRGEGPEVLAQARRTEGLMARSLLEKGKALEVERPCTEEPRADRRGLLVWTLSRCEAQLGCKVTAEGYACAEPKSRE